MSQPFNNSVLLLSIFEYKSKKNSKKILLKTPTNSKKNGVRFKLNLTFPYVICVKGNMSQHMNWYLNFLKALKRGRTGRSMLNCLKSF